MFKTIRDDLKEKYGWKGQAGGLSGNDPDFRYMSTTLIAHIYRETKGSIFIHGAGGVHNTETTLEKIKAGASTVHIVTGIRQEGPAIAGKINRGLMEYMNKYGIKNIRELVGVGKF